MNDELIKIILQVAEVPSFTTFEERLHPFVRDFCEGVDVKPQFIDGNNVLIEAAGTGVRSVALSAHLDKNNYWDDNPPEEIPVENNGEYLRGLLDDAVGVGVCLYLLKQSALRKFPPLQILLSECEESFGFRRHPQLLKNGGDDTHPGIGACRLSHYLVEQQKIPGALVVVDVTPKFRGDPGIALYSRPWEMHGNEPTADLEEQTEALAAAFHRLCPRMKDYNNTNDYVTYGEQLNQNDMTVPCFALEPAVNNYHSPEEEVFVDDIAETAEVLAQFLESFATNNSSEANFIVRG